MTQQVTETEFRISARRSIVKGDRFTLGVVRRKSYHLPAVRGLFQVKSIWSETFRGNRRVFIDAVEVAEAGGGAVFGAARTFFVAGKPFTKSTFPGVRFVPYVVKPQRKKRGATVGSA